MDPHLLRLQAEISATLSGLAPEELNHRAPGKWSTAEVLEHLYLTYTGTAKGFERVASAGKSLATTSTWRQRGAALMVVGFGYLPAGRQSPALARPRGLPAETVVADICAKIAEMDASIALCEQKLGKRGKVLDHPILGPLTARQWRKFHLVHGRHHIKQIQRMKKSALKSAHPLTQRGI